MLCSDQMDQRSLRGRFRMTRVNVISHLTVMICADFRSDGAALSKMDRFALFRSNVISYLDVMPRGYAIYPLGGAVRGSSFRWVVTINNHVTSSTQSQRCLRCFHVTFSSQISKSSSVGNGRCKCPTPAITTHY